MNQEVEIWKDIEGYDGKYQISNFGVVRTLLNKKWNPLKYPKIMKSHYDKDGYKRIALAKNAKYHMFIIHRLVAKYFVENPENKSYINHIDGVKDNNHYKNLEWCTILENNRHARFILGNFNDKRDIITGRFI